MTEPQPITAESRPSLLDVNHRFGRLTRLALKELREILRDRRTIITLVFMPLLLYPLMSIAFQRFFLTSLGNVATPRYLIGFTSEEEMRFLSAAFHLGDTDNPPANSRDLGDSEDSHRSEIVIEGDVRPDLEAAVRDLNVDAGLRLVDGRATGFDPRTDVALDCEVLYLTNSVTSRRAAEHIEQRIAEWNERFLSSRLQALRVTQRAVPVQLFKRGLQNTGTAAPISIAAVIPFILILMTVTGAVYPAIDLTAGERERGTLEILVAAPIPRLGLLLAKYVAVLTCALLTAGANLITMTITISVSGIGRLLFGDDGLSLPVILAVAGLLVLFAAFFSAVLLMITSFARSFKEAQAYLIPLMLISLAPGMMSLLPGVEQKGLLVVVPLMNIVLLGRDLFEFNASAGTTIMVVMSTSVYALVAISLAARVFGGESVLYSNQVAWSDWLRRARHVQPTPNLTGGLACLAILFPSYFWLNSLIAQSDGMPMTTRLLTASAATALLFAVWPLFAAWHGRVQLRTTFALNTPRWTNWLAAVLLGVSLWTAAHELVLLTQRLGLITLDSEKLDRAQTLLGELRGVALPIVLSALALVPAVCEEMFFRGYLFAAFSNRSTPRTTIVSSAVVFGLFHVVVTDALAIERLLPSTMLGLVLGLMRHRSGSLWPGIVLHACHNGLLTSASYFQPQLAAAGWGVAEEAHLPAAWLGGSVIVMAIGFGVLWLNPAPEKSATEASHSEPRKLETPID